MSTVHFLGPRPRHGAAGSSCQCILKFAQCTVRADRLRMAPERRGGLERKGMPVRAAALDRNRTCGVLGSRRRTETTRTIWVVKCPGCGPGPLGLANTSTFPIENVKLKVKRKVVRSDSVFWGSFRLYTRTFQMYRVDSECCRRAPGGSQAHVVAKATTSISEWNEFFSLYWRF